MEIKLLHNILMRLLLGTEEKSNRVMNKQYKGVVR